MGSHDKEWWRNYAAAILCPTVGNALGTTSGDLSLVVGFYRLAHIEDGSSNSLLRLLGAVHLLRSCLYDITDIYCVLAHATVYFQQAVLWTNAPVDAGLWAVMYIHLAHTYTLDIHVPLRTWHQYSFSGICDLPTLERWVLQLLALRGYVLRIHPEVVEQRISELSNGHDRG